MAEIIITIPDAQLTRVVTSFANGCGYQPTIFPDGTPNPETRAQFARRMLVEFIKTKMRHAEVQSGLQTLDSTITGDIEGINIGAS